MGSLEMPTVRSHCIHAATFADGIPCVLTMKREDGNWRPAGDGWSLTHAETDDIVVPPNFITPSKVEISDWELMDFAVGYVCEDLEKQGWQVFSRNSDLNLFPSIFFEKQDRQQGFVQVCPSRYPDQATANNEHLQQIKQQVGHGGYLARVTIASEHDSFDPDSEQGHPLYRGDGYLVAYGGLEEV